MSQEYQIDGETTDKVKDESYWNALKTLKTGQRDWSCFCQNCAYTCQSR